MNKQQHGSSIPLAAAQEAFASAANAAQRGIAQFITPLSMGNAVGRLLPANRETIVDLNCADGSLLIGVSNITTERILGCDIDPCHTLKNERGLHLNKVVGDLGKFAPLLDDVNWRADLFALNPPYGLHWHIKSFDFLGGSEMSDVRAAFLTGPKNDEQCPRGCIDSSIATILTALHFMSLRGEGVAICNDATMRRLIFDTDAPYRPIRNRFWRYVRIKGNPMTGSDRDAFGNEFVTAVLYFAADHHGGCPQPETFDSVADFDADCVRIGDLEIRRGRMGSRVGSPGHYHVDTNRLFQAAKDEFRQRTDQAKPKYNIWLNESGIVETQLSVYEQHSATVDKALAEKLFELNGKSPMQLVMQRSQRQALLSTVNGGIWKVHPLLPGQIEDAIQQYNAVRAPLYPLSEIQRLGYLDEQDMITCKKDLVKTENGRKVKIFSEGESYPIRTQSVSVERMTVRPDSQGYDCDFLISGRELAIFIKDARAGEQCFMDARIIGSTDGRIEIGDKVKPEWPLQCIVDHFDIPEVPDVADCNPERFKFYQDELDRIVSLTSKKQPLKGFQKMDISRAAMVDGLIGAWDTGLGKSRKAILWPLLKVGCEQKRVAPMGRILLVAPENLHDQLSDEAFETFGISFTKIDTIDKFRKLSPLPPGFYISSFTQVASNGVQKLPDMSSFFMDGSAQSFKDLASHMMTYNVTYEEAEKMKLDDELTKEPMSPSRKIIKICRMRQEEYSQGIGQTQNGIRCIYSPSLADVARDAFDAVVFDEGTKLKGEETLVGMGCRALNPKYRLVLTATPIKNRLPDIFWLGHWASGGHAEACPRWPYSMKEGEQDRFAAEFLMMERNLTKERAAEVFKGKPAPSNESLRKKKKRGKATADVCNIHRLWKLISPIIVRRRKRDIGEYIVPAVKRPIRVPMGEAQAKTYSYHLQAVYTDKKGDPVILPQLLALRSAAAAPNSSLLVPVPGTIMRDENKAIIPNPDRFARSSEEYTPKLAAILVTIAEVMERGEQIVVFSAFEEPLDTLSRRLSSAGIPHYVADGRESPKSRGAMASDFKKGLPHAKPVMLCGMKSMSEGNSWHHCNNVVVFAYDWAMDLYEQAINRVHRLNSYRPVNIYTVICDGTIDRRLESLTGEKLDAAELVLDGQLAEKNTEELSYAKLLAIAREEFATAKFIPESKLEEDWDALRERLAKAFNDNCLPEWVKGPAVDVESKVEFVSGYEESEQSEPVGEEGAAVAVAVIQQVHTTVAQAWF